MAKRKPTDTAQMNLRLPEKLRRMIEVEAKKNGHSLNRELVRRLEQSFANQSTSEVIASAAQSAGLETVRILTAQWNEVLKAQGRPELALDANTWRPVEMFFEIKNQLPVTTTDVKAPADEE